MQMLVILCIFNFIVSLDHLIVVQFVGSMMILSEFWCLNIICLQIVIGCDGIRSPIAKWIGFSEPKYVGHCAYRGLGYYPNGQPFEPKLNYIYGRGVRAGYVPVSPTKVYWFICYNNPTPGYLALVMLKHIWMRFYSAKN